MTQNSGLQSSLWIGGRWRTGQRSALQLKQVPASQCFVKETTFGFISVFSFNSRILILFDTKARQ